MFSKALSLSLVVGCTRLHQAAAGLFATSFAKYPNYTGSLTVTGSVLIGQAGMDTVLWYKFSGLDSTCTGTGNGKNNSCGVHIHAGMTCTEAGGHFYSATEDPWATVIYTASSGEGKNVVVKTGKTQMDNKGRAFVVHDVDGVRVACAILEEDKAKSGTSPLYVDSFSKYPGYMGTKVVKGSAEITETVGYESVAQFLTFSLMGADKDCSANAVLAQANACGIHVHVGNCSVAADVAGHYYMDNLVNGTTDPWKNIIYTAASTGAVGSSITVQIPTKQTNVNMKDRSLVVHDKTGARIACGNIVTTKTTGTGTSIVSGAPSGSLAASLLSALLLRLFFPLLA